MDDGVAAVLAGLLSVAGVDVVGQVNAGIE